MKRADLQKFIAENYLLTKDVFAACGIYAITIDDYIVYIGQSKNVYERCSTHIYNIENAMLINEKKYLLLLSAKLGGHKVDCVGIAYGGEDCLTIAENYYIDCYKPCLNILTPNGKNNIEDLKIEDVLNSLQWKVEQGVEL